MVRLDAASQRLWEALFGHAPAPPQLPPCAAGLRFFVYNLSLDYNAHLLSAMERRRGASSCSYARAPCMENARSMVASTGASWDYSNLRQYGAEVPLLAKLMLLPRAQRPEEADYFVVPWFASTELSSARKGRHFNPHNQLAHRRVHELLRSLPHFRDSWRRRHIFLSSREHALTISALRRLVQSTGAILLHYGPLRPNATSEFVIAPNDAGFGAQLEPLAPVRHRLFAMFDPQVHRLRAAMGRALRSLNASRPAWRVAYFPIRDHRTLSLPPARALAIMRRSAVCPILQGDYPYTHRIFDAIAAGCVPLLLTYRVTLPSGRRCEAWGWDPRSHTHANDPRARFAPTYPHACHEHVLPFPSTVPWHNITMRLRASGPRVGAPKVLERLLAGLDWSEARRTRERLGAIRHLFTYDWNGRRPDAFTALLAEMCARSRLTPDLLVGP